MDIMKEIDTYVQPIEQYAPINPKYYKTKKQKNAVLIPISNILINFDIKKSLYELREKLSTEYIDLSTPKLRERLLQLNANLRGLFVKFLNNMAIDPVNVQRAYEINEPSLTDHDRPSVLGLETVYLQHRLRDVDYLYYPSDGFDLIALSIYFKYDHVPVIIKV